MGKAPKPFKKQTILSISQLSKNFVCFNIVPKSWVINCVCVHAHMCVCFWEMCKMRLVGLKH